MSTELVLTLVHAISVPIDLLHKGLKSVSPFKSTTLCIDHRSHTRKQYFERAFGSGKDVLLLTIMSQHTVKEIKHLLQLAQKTKTHIRCLTWYPDPAPETVESFRKHLGEYDAEPQRTLRQVQEARAEWQRLEKEYPDVLQVLCYSSSPTMGAVIVRDKFALVELMPYHAQPMQRPALVLGHFKDRKAFRFFAERFEELWSESQKKNTSSSIQRVV
ncbi:MAG TPA: hypothetical protein VFR24_14195 [Candidatus Angelobacter sp.]|nr:hypothetical protein [Candidatus Angelobacter sp.]